MEEGVEVLGLLELMLSSECDDGGEREQERWREDLDYPSVRVGVVWAEAAEMLSVSLGVIVEGTCAMALAVHTAKDATRSRCAWTMGSREANPPT